MRVALELDLGHAGAGSANVARRGVDEEILPCAVTALLLRDRGRGQEDLPGELVHRVGARAMHVAHEERDVVASVGNEAVDEKVAAGGGHATPRLSHHPLGGPGVSPNASDIRFDGGKCH